MDLLLVGNLPTLQMMTGRAGLTARLAARTATQTPLLLGLVRRRLGITIGRGRLGGVARVLPQPRAQLHDNRLKLGDPRLLLGDQRIPLDQQRLKLTIRLAI
jgi:hypothetical protein